MQTRRSHSCPDRANSLAARREGFTLVEMLVSVTLVLIMMAMFAQVFEIASGIHVKTRGMSTNDQRTRILSTLIRSDLNKLTIRNATPFRHMEDRDRTIIDRDLSNRQGYLYVSENNPANDLDDVLQFTATADLRLADFTDSAQFAGKSINLHSLGLQVLYDQPDWDDGHANHASESADAEISYFVRAGALYRRVLLLRQPAGGNSAQPKIDEDKNQNGHLHQQTEDFNNNQNLDEFEAMASPKYRGEDTNGNGQLDQGEDTNGNGQLDPARSFWNDFDHSAHWDIDILCATFHGTGTLNNSVGVGCYTEPSPALGKRRYRFGHSLAINIAREYDDVGAFLGRFTHEETSNQLFRYPTISFFSPLDPHPTTHPILRDPADGVVARFRNGPRRSEDLLMTNVHSFDVKILRACDLHEDTNGNGQLDPGEDFNGNGILDLSDPGSLTLYDEDFDTLHPRDSHLLASEDVNGDGYFNHINMGNPAQYEDGLLYDEDINGNRRLDTEDKNGNGVLDPSEDTNGNGQLDTEDRNGNGVLDPSEDTNGNGQLDSGEDTNNNGRLDLAEDINGNGMLDTEDTNGNGLLDPTEDINGNGRLDYEDLNNNGTLDTEDLNGNGILDTEDRDGDNRLDRGEDINNNLRLDYGEDYDEDINGNNILDRYLPHRWTRNMNVARSPQWPRLPSEDQNGNGKLDQGEDLNGNNQLDFFYNEDRDGDGQLDQGEDLNGNNRLDHYVVRARSRPGTNGMWFRPVSSGRTGYREPEWPSRLGLGHDRRSSADWRGRAYDGSVLWQAIPDRHRAMGIQITIRLLDPKSGQLRQVTILHPLTGN
jgi:prepilin-type N-terminal cleavage/methylation domain-containing protein